MNIGRKPKNATIGYVEPRATESEIFNLRMVAKGRFDAALITLDTVKRIELLSIEAMVKPNFKVVCDFGTLPSYIAFSTTHPQADAALSAFNDGIAIVAKNGTLARLQKEWAGKALFIASINGR